MGQGETPLLWASEEDEVEVVELLLKSGASVEVKNNKGRGPRASQSQGRGRNCGSQGGAVASSITVWSKCLFLVWLIYRNSLRAAPCLVFKTMTMSYPNSLKAVDKACCNIANACLDEVGAAANSSAAGLIVAFAVTVAFFKPLFETLASALLAGIWRVKSRTNSQNRAATSNTYIYI